MSVDVTLSVAPRTAAWLQDAAERARMGRLLDWLMRRASLADLLRAMDCLQAGAEANGLIEQILEEELAAYNAERRNT